MNCHTWIYIEYEGDLGIHPKQVYQVDMGTIMPKELEWKKLFVTAVVSSSHIAFGSIRMEPVFMILRQSAGIMAGMALENDDSIQDLSNEMIKPEL